MKCDAIYKTPFWRDAGLNGFGINDSGAARAVFDNSPPRTATPACCSRSSAARPGASTAPMTQGQAPGQAVLEGFAAMFGDQALHPIDYVEHDWTKERWTGGGPTAIHAPGSLVAVRPGDPHAARPRALGRHRDLDVLDRLHGRRRPLRRARRDRGAGPAVRRLLLLLAGTLALVSPVGAAAPRARRARGWRHRGLRAGPGTRASRRTSTRTATGACTPAPTSTPASAGTPSRVFEWSGDGHAAAVVGRARPGRSARTTASRSPTRPRTGRLVAARDLDRVGAAPSTRAPGRLRTGRDGSPTAPCPTTRRGGRGGALFVTDYADGVIWKVPPARARPTRWFKSSALDRRDRVRHHRHPLPARPAATC